MRQLITIIIPALVLLGCSGGESEVPEQTAAAQPKIVLNVEEPAPLPVPDPKTPKSDEDWEARVHNKEIEVIQIINLINPVAAYLQEGFKQYGDKFSSNLHAEWEDTQAQLTQALGLYESCKKRKQAGQYNKQLFLDLEGTWQLLVKTGVAGIRTKTMMDAELQKIAAL